MIVRVVKWYLNDSWVLVRWSYEVDISERDFVCEIGNYYEMQELQMLKVTRTSCSVVFFIFIGKHNDVVVFCPNSLEAKETYCHPQLGKHPRIVGFTIDFTNVFFLKSWAPCSADWKGRLKSIMGIRLMLSNKVNWHVILFVSLLL